MFRSRVFLSGLIYEEVLHYHPDQAARFRNAAADAAGAAVATATDHNTAEQEEPASSGAKRPADATTELQEPDHKRKRVAVEGGGALTREHTLPSTAAAAAATLKMEQRR